MSDHNEGQGDVETDVRLEKRTCAWCGEWMTYSGRGPRPKYCSKAHRNRAWEVRSAQRRLGRDLAAGTVTTGPVREIVSLRPVPAEVKVPTRMADWVAQLAELQTQLGEDGALRGRHWDHGKLLTALWDTMDALGKATPGGLARLQKTVR